MARCPALLGARDSLRRTLTLMVDAFSAGGKLLICGNGGSAADAEHMAVP